MIGMRSLLVPLFEKNSFITGKSRVSILKFRDISDASMVCKNDNTTSRFNFSFWILSKNNFLASGSKLFFERIQNEKLNREVVLSFLQTIEASDIKTTF